MITKIKNIKIANLNISFSDVDLQNNKQDNKFVCFAGENGAGKTTLFKTIESLSQKQNNLYLNNLEFSGNNHFSTDNTIFIKHEDINTPVKKPNIRNVVDDSIVTKAMWRHNETIIGGEKYSADDFSKQAIVDKMLELKIMNNQDLINYLQGKTGIDFNAELCKTDLYIFKEIVNKYLHNSFQFDPFAEKWLSNEHDVDEISTGEQQMLLSVMKIFGELSIFKREDLLKNPIYIFFDEVEAYLHPRWQYAILGLIKETVEIFTKNYQIFFTTHSREVVDSALTNKEISKSSLIVRLEKHGNVITNQFFDKNSPIIGGAAEINYQIFYIPTIEYFICLYENKRELLQMTYLNFDNYIRTICSKLPNIEVDPTKYSCYTNGQTFISRIRHLIAHGINNNEHNYLWYTKQTQISSDTKKFYDSWFSEDRKELLDDGIKVLLSIH